ncbi:MULTISPECIES: MAB_1171c family putative transporter [unclassified Streptomyces]|uniref:MAB_1171c family putative transporter n=1 Tax=unclassified Streptomyces TaxID=2593676 RepID=UPI0037F6E353
MTAPTLHLGFSPAGFVNEFYPTFWWVPACVLTAALAIKVPSIIRLWGDPLLRAVGGLLLLACAVFVFVAPSTIAWVNRVTGVTNISAPWVYSLLTAYCGSCLLLIIAWRNGLSDRSRSTVRATRWVIASYSGVIVVLWVLFALADTPVERLRDLDTYYADTPYAREMIVLYLLAHTVATVITSWLIWNWVRTDGLDAWLRWGLKFLGVGYGVQLVFDAAKLTAVTARWFGNDLNWLSTGVAPPIACLSAILIAVGFILPHAGQFLHDRWRVRLAHRELRPLYQLMRSVNGGGMPVVLRTTPELRLIRRETFIRDVLLPLAGHIDQEQRARAHEAALSLGLDPGRAKAAAAALGIQDAVAARHRTAVDDTDDGHDTTDLLRDIVAVSRALGDPAELLSVRVRARVLASGDQGRGGPGEGAEAGPVDRAIPANHSLGDSGL